MVYIGGSRGRARCTSPYGTQFFHFRIHFHQKVPISEVHTPPMGARPPYRKSWIRHWFTSLNLDLAVKTSVSHYSPLPNTARGITETRWFSQPNPDSPPYHGVTYNIRYLWNFSSQCCSFLQYMILHYFYILLCYIDFHLYNSIYLQAVFFNSVQTKIFFSHSITLVSFKIDSVLYVLYEY